MRFLIDTSVCVFFLRGKFNLDKSFMDVGLINCCISEITLLELRYGAENSKEPERSNKSLDLFLAGLNIIPIQSCIRRYAKEKVRLNKMGKPLHDDFDLLIGVTAVEHELTLVTDNVKDFKNIKGIKLENWVKK